MKRFLLILFLVSVVLVSGCIRPEIDHSSYYKDLANNCETGDDCCLDSVKIMFENNYVLAPDSGCPEGSLINALKCGTSYAWCEPSADKNNGRPAGIDPDCKKWNDGCNTCSIDDDGFVYCTEMYCEEYGEAKCLDEPNEPRICPTVCIPMWVLKDNKCTFNDCGSGCGADGITTFETETECLAKL